MAQILLFAYALIIFISLFLVVTSGGMSFFIPFSNLLIHPIHNTF